MDLRTPLGHGHRVGRMGIPRRQSGSPLPSRQRGRDARTLSTAGCRPSPPQDVAPLGSMVDYTPAQWEGFVRRAWRFILAIALRTPRDSAFPWLGPVREQIEAQWAEFLSWQLSDCPETESTSVTVNPAVDFALREAQTEGMLEFTASDPEHPENMHAHTNEPFQRGDGDTQQLCWLAPFTPPARSTRATPPGLPKPPTSPGRHLIESRSW